MEIQRLKINVEQCYITKPIDHETIGNPNYITADSRAHEIE